MELETLSYIENVKVEIYLSGILIKTGYTDALGTYKTNVAAGLYTIVLSKDGYNTITKVETITRPTELMVNLPASALAVIVEPIPITPVYNAAWTEKVIAAYGKNPLTDALNKVETILFADSLLETDALTRSESVVITNV
jgi:hypothetical protein